MLHLGPKDLHQVGSCVNCILQDPRGRGSLRHLGTTAERGHTRDQNITIDMNPMAVTSHMSVTQSTMTMKHMPDMILERDILHTLLHHQHTCLEGHHLSTGRHDTLQHHHETVHVHHHGQGASGEDHRTVGKDEGGKNAAAYQFFTAVCEEPLYSHYNAASMRIHLCNGLPSYSILVNHRPL